MSLLTLARIVAVPVSAWLIIALTVNPDYRADNIFAVPDFTFSLLLLIAAFLPRRLATPALLAGFYFGAGVITIAALERFELGQAPQGWLNLTIAALYVTVAALLTLDRTTTPSHAPA